MKRKTKLIYIRNIILFIFLITIIVLTISIKKVEPSLYGNFFENVGLEISEDVSEYKIVMKSTYNKDDEEETKLTYTIETKKLDDKYTFYMKGEMIAEEKGSFELWLASVDNNEYVFIKDKNGKCYKELYDDFYSGYPFINFSLSTIIEKYLYKIENNLANETSNLYSFFDYDFVKKSIKNNDNVGNYKMVFKGDRLLKMNYKMMINENEYEKMDILVSYDSNIVLPSFDDYALIEEGKHFDYSSLLN